jgi:hypothetical protein
MSHRVTLILFLSALPAAVLLPSGTPARGAVITQWTFNTSPSDNAPNTGTTIPETGAGTITPIGGITGAFAQGSSNDNSATATDGNNNSSLETSGYPAFDSANKTAGIEVAVSTAGFQDVVLSFEHRHAPGASANFRIQYASDGVNYIDGVGYTASGANVFSLRTQDFAAIPAIDDNPLARFRVVAEFQGQTYSGTSQSYMPNANNRFDVLTVSGTPIPEPAAAGAAVVLGLLGLVLRRRRLPVPAHKDESAKPHEAVGGAAGGAARW